MKNLFEIPDTRPKFTDGKSIILVMGFPGSGKSSYTKSLIEKGYYNLNLDKEGPTNYYNRVDEVMKQGQKIVLDNTYVDIASRKRPIELAKKYGYTIEAWVMSTTLEDAQYNAVKRQLERYGKLITPENKHEVKNDPNMFMPAVQYAYRKNFIAPTTFEGFDVVKTVQFKRNAYSKEYVNKAIIFDYDGTLRKTKSGNNYPVTEDDIEILPGRKEKLKQLKKEGYILLGVSNQSGVGKGVVKYDTVKHLFEVTNKMLGVDIDVEFCSHSVPPIVCFCRKPSPGLGVHFIEKYKLDPNQVTMVGDMKTDETFAKRCGFKFINEKSFFLC